MSKLKQIGLVAIGLSLIIIAAMSITVFVVKVFNAFVNLFA